MEKVIAVFEVGEIKKRFFLFNHDLNVVFQSEEIFSALIDENGFECENISAVENWIITSLEEVIKSKNHEVIAVNYTTSEASLAFLNGEGELLFPIYHNSWPMSQDVVESLYEKYGGRDEFCRKTGSPSTGMLNSGFQILWLKKERKDLFDQMAYVLHYPQYLPHIFTHSIVSECTSIGCHTAMWDYDNKTYHRWLSDEGIILTNPMCNHYTVETNVACQPILSGIGVHDLSAMLVPFLRSSQEKFVFVSTGKRCVNMNPFNQEPLTVDQLNNDCFYLFGDNRNPFQATRWEMGQIYDAGVKQLAGYFRIKAGREESVEIDDELIASFLEKGDEKFFFKGGVDEDFVEPLVDLRMFSSFKEAYHRLMFDLTLREVESLKLVAPEKDEENIIVLGDFAENEIFIRLMASFFPERKVFTSLVNYPGALGAALVIWHTLDDRKQPVINLQLKEWKPFDSKVELK